MELGPGLAKVRKCLDKADDAGALTALLGLWRSHRLPRLADLVDRVGARIDSERGPIKAKSVKERTEAWLALAAQKDPTELGRLLATPWPGTWQPALPVLQALIAFPDDPRMAMALALIVDETPYDTWTSSRFYRPLFARLDKLRDLRALPLLEAQLARDKSHYHKRDMRPMEEKAVARLKAAFPDGLPKLSKSEDESLAAIEALFSTEVRNEQSKSKGEAEFLAEIYASPDDDGLRQVFADWLSERGDPRGELIVLQLAPEVSDAMRKRQATLLNKHGEAWAGPLDRFLSKKGRVFERGFLAAGTLELEGRPKQPPAGLSDPAWATMRCLRFVGEEALIEAIVQLPSMRSLRSLLRLPERAAWALARGEVRPLVEELEIDPAYEPDLAQRATLLAGKAFPSLRSLSIETQELADLDWLLPSPLARNLERLQLRNYEYPIGPFLEAIDRHGLAVKEAVLSERTHLDEWVLTLTRDDRGKLGRLRCGFSSKMPSPYDLVRALETLDPDALREIVVDKPKNLGWDRHYILMAEEAIARFTGLVHVDVPWERLSTKEAIGQAFELSLYGEGLGTREKLPALWKLLHEPPFSVALDGYEVNYSKHTSFGKDPLAEILEVLAKKRTSSVRAYRKDAADLASMRVTVSGQSLELHVPEVDVDAYVRLLVKLLDSADVERGSVPFRTVDEDGEEVATTIEIDPPFTYREPHFGFVTVFGPSTFFAFDELAEVAARFGFRSVRSKRNLVLVARDRTSPPDETTQTQMKRAFSELLWRTHRAKRGYVLPELVREVLGPELARRGFVEVELPEPTRTFGHVYYRQAHPSGARAIRIEPRFPAIEAEIDVELRQTRGAVDADLLEDCERSTGVGVNGFGYNDQLPGATELEARASLRDVVNRLDGPIAGWFEEQPKKRQRRL